MTEIDIVCADTRLFAQEKNQDVGNEDVTALTLLQWIYKWGFQESLPNLTIVL